MVVLAPGRALPLKSVIILINHVIEYILYTVPGLKKKSLYQKDILYCLVYPASKGMTLALEPFDSYQLKIQKVIR